MQFLQQKWRVLLAVACGGLVGTGLRYSLLEYVAIGGDVAKIVAVNMVGSAVIGIFVGLRARLSQTIFAFGAVGFCGGLTTFSTFALQTAQYIEDGLPGQAALLVTATALPCVLVAGVGYRVGSLA